MSSAPLRAKVRVRRFFCSSAERLAGLATSIYLSSVIVMVGWRMPEFSSLPLNELGDFLAGVFGPLAVFWLVLGYYQQGKELRISSQALLAQCVELANSAEQQRLALEVSRSQMELAQEKHIVELLELEESIRPRSSVGYVNSGSTHSGEWINFEVFIFNAAAYELEVLWREGGVEYSAMTVGYMGAKAKESFQLNFGRGQAPRSFDISVYCKNVRGRGYGYHFTYTESVGKVLITARPPSPTTIKKCEIA